MAGEISFDVVSDFDEQELRNALDQVRREVQQRYDFKGAHVDLTQEKDAPRPGHRQRHAGAGDPDLIESQGRPAQPVAQDLRLGRGRSRPAATRSARRSRCGAACPTTWRAS